MCGVIVVDAESFWSIWHGRDAYIHNHCLGYHHNFALFYQLLNSNLFTHRIIFFQERSLWWNLWPPGLFSIILVSDLLFLQSFIFRSINQKIQKYFIFCLVLFISIRSHFCKWPWRDWQSLYRVGCKVLCLFVWVRGTFEEPPTRLIPWFSKLREILTLLLLHHPFLFKENQRKLNTWQEGFLAPLLRRSSPKSRQVFFS